MGRLQDRKERNKKMLEILLTDTYYIQYGWAFAKESEEIMIEQTAELFRDRIVDGCWTWVDITSLLTKIKYKMDYEVFVDLYKEYSSEVLSNYGNWSIKDVIKFLACLAVRHTKVLKNIFEEYEKEA